MEKLTDFFAMGGYAAYVWPSYSIALVALLYMGVSSLYSLKKAKNALESLKSPPESTFSS